MFRKLSLLGALAVVLATLAYAANVPPHHDAAGRLVDSPGVVLIDTAGEPYTAAASGATSDGVYNSAGVTLSDGDHAPLQMDAKGSVHFVPTDTAGTPIDLTQPAEVASNTISIPVAQTVTASSAYAANNAVGGLITFANAARTAGTGIIQSALVKSKSAQTTQMDAIFFKGNPSGSTCTDKTALSIAAADFDKVIGVAHIADWTSLGTPSLGQSLNLAKPFQLTSGTSLYACLVTRSTPTFTATTDITVEVDVLRN